MPNAKQKVYRADSGSYAGLMKYCQIIYFLTKILLFFGFRQTITIDRPQESDIYLGHVLQKQEELFHYAFAVWQPIFVGR